MKIIFKNTTGVKYANLKTVVSGDDLRPAMQGVYIDLKNSCLVATDAHVLITYPIEVIENDSDQDGFIVPIDYFNHLRYMIRFDARRKMIFDVEYILTDNYAEIHYFGEMIYRCKYIDAKYPNWSAVIPDPKGYPEKPSEIGLNLHILKRLCAGLPASDYEPVLKMETTSVNHAVVFSTTNPDYKTHIKAIVMSAKLSK